MKTQKILKTVPRAELMKMNSITLTKLRRLILIRYNVCKVGADVALAAELLRPFIYNTETYVRWHSGQRVLYAPGANRGSFTHTQKNWWCVFKPAMHEECRFFPFNKNTKSIPRILKIQGLYIYSHPARSCRFFYNTISI